MRELSSKVVTIAVEGYDNRIVVGGPRSLAARELRRRTAASPILGEMVPQLTFRTLR